MIVAGVPAELKRALVDDARALDVSINDRAATILCERFNVRRDPSGVAFRPEHGSTRMMFGVPAELRTKIRVKAAQQGSTMRAIVIETLADHYALAVAA